MITGETSSLMPTLAGSPEKAELGALLFVPVVVTQGVWTALAVVVQPEGSAGAVTPSKFCVKIAATPPRG